MFKAQLFLKTEEQYFSTKTESIVAQSYCKQKRKIEWIVNIHFRIATTCLPKQLGLSSRQSWFTDFEINLWMNVFRNVDKNDILSICWDDVLHSLFVFSNDFDLLLPTIFHYDEFFQTVFSVDESLIIIQ